LPWSGHAHRHTGPGNSLQIADDRTHNPHNQKIADSDIRVPISKEIAWNQIAVDCTLWMDVAHRKDDPHNRDLYQRPWLSLDNPTDPCIDIPLHG
jgi:hypothetical protein